MRIEKSAAMKAKFEALRWLRIDQRCMFIATEVGNYSADVLGISEKKMIEIEVKVTFEDFKNDFRKYKHQLYNGVWNSSEEGIARNQWIPTHFYFAVTPDLIEKVKDYLDSMNKEQYKRVDHYGVIDCSTWNVVKRAKWIHKNPPNNRVKCTTALRMGSELIRFHEAWL